MWGLLFAVGMFVGAGKASAPCGDLYLTEIHPDPAKLRDNTGEFIEVYNASSTEQSTQGWSLQVNDSTLQLPITTIGPKAVVVFSRGQLGAQISHELWPKLRLPNGETDLQFSDPCQVTRQKLVWGRRPYRRLRSGYAFELVWRRGSLQWRTVRRIDARYGDRVSPGSIAKGLSRRLAPRGTRSRPAVSRPSGSKQTVRPTDG